MHVDNYMKHFTVGYDWTLRWLYEGSYCKKAYLSKVIDRECIILLPEVVYLVAIKTTKWILEYFTSL